jgi:predicted metal-dependent peptidase
MKPKSKKYENNGGDIPPEWCLIEFLIIHELMHYTHDDFYYTKIYKADPNIINWVGDFRNNYTMTKIGIEHLPIGLYNDHINYDRQKSYREMYNIVKREFDKLSDDAKKKVEKVMGEMGDDHSGHHKKDVSDESGVPTEDELDEHAKRQGRALEKRKDGEKAQPQDKQQGNNIGNRGGRGSKDDDIGKLDPWSKIRPTFNWRSLLAKFVAKAKPDEEETYAKPSRKAVTSVSQAVQTGAGVMKPSEQPLSPKVSLAVIVDSSGSMHGVLPKIYSNLDNLMKINDVAEFRLSKYSGSIKHYALWPKKKTYSVVDNVKAKPKEITSGSLSDLFSETLDGATNFDADVAATIRGYASLGFNQLIISDADILDGENLTVFKDLVKTVPNLFVIFDSASTFQQACKAVGNVSPNFSHL